MPGGASRPRSGCCSAPATTTTTSSSPAPTAPRHTLNCSAPPSADRRPQRAAEDPPSRRPPHAGHPAAEGRRADQGRERAPRPCHRELPSRRLRLGAVGEEGRAAAVFSRLMSAPHDEPAQGFSASGQALARQLPGRGLARSRNAARPPGGRAPYHHAARLAHSTRAGR